MTRELPRTLYSMSPAFQQGVDKDDYEVVLVDNGSKNPPRAEDFAYLEMNLSVYSMEGPTHSPVRAINFGINQSIGQFIGVCIDGARMVSPGLIARVRDALTIYDRGVVAARGRYLGHEFQRDAMRNGYNAQQEDVLLARSGWRDDGYRLFDISVFDESGGETWISLMAESNALFMSRHMWSELGGFDEQFTSRGGGLVNLDTWTRAIRLPNVTVVTLMGEATFHQIHGGVATNGSLEVIEEFYEEYRSIRGFEFELQNIPYLLFGAFNHKVRGRELHPRSKIVTKKQSLQFHRRIGAKYVGRFLPSFLRRTLRNLADITGAVLSGRPFREIQKLKVERNHARILEVSPYFDASWYASTYPDVIAAGYQPSVHYVRHGFAQQREPSRYFDAAWYSDINQDVADNRQNPLLHYILFGEAEGRVKRTPPAHVWSSHVEQFSEENIEAIRTSQYFDAEWYQGRYPEVAQSGYDFAEHFLIFGCLERKNPSSYFDTAKYLQINPDVELTGTNPLLHYELHGRHEGRRIYAVTAE